MVISKKTAKRQQMRNGAWMKWIIPILLIALTLSSLTTSCQTIESVAEQKPKHVTFPLEADIRAVNFVDAPKLGGILLTYENYRVLEKNIIEYRREIADLRDTLKRVSSGG